MTDERWHDLMWNDEEKLTQQEISEGWHWCSGMDDLLANCNDPDGDCFCELRKTFSNIPMIGAAEVCPESGHEPVFHFEKWTLKLIFRCHRCQKIRMGFRLHLWNSGAWRVCSKCDDEIPF